MDFLAPQEFILLLHFVDFCLGSDTFQLFKGRYVRGRSEEVFRVYLRGSDVLANLRSNLFYGAGGYQ
jgi:hypothetical protein